MGVDIASLLVKKTIALEDLTGRKIAVDAMNVLYQFLTIIRQPDGTPLRDSKGRVTSHLSGLFYRTIRLLENGAKPCFVFDGEYPKFKTATAESRRTARKEAQEKYTAALQRGDEQEARKYAVLGTTVNDQILNDSKALLEAMGIPYVQAPSEGEAQASFMAQQGDVWAVSSQDYDVMLFGAPLLLRNIAIGSKRKLPGKKVSVEVQPEIIELQETLKTLGVTREQLITIGILIGTDFNPGFRGIGPKKALDIVKRKPTLAHALEGFVWDLDYTPQEIMQFFLSPPVTRDYALKWKEPDTAEIVRIMVEEHEFGLERVESAMKKLEEAKGTQGRLDQWTRK